MDNSSVIKLDESNFDRELTQDDKPVIVDFWETILLDNPVYKKNAMAVHYELAKKVRLQKIHFDTWLFLFNETVDELYEGKIATLAKTRAKSIASIMLIKMEETYTKNYPNA